MGVKTGADFLSFASKPELKPTILLWRQNETNYRVVESKLRLFLSIWIRRRGNSLKRSENQSELSQREVETLSVPQRLLNSGVQSILIGTTETNRNRVALSDETLWLHCL